MKFERSEHNTFKCNAFFITLTYDRTGLMVGEAWDEAPGDYHRYMAWLVKHFGRVAPIRAFSSHKDNYPHIHVIVIFADQSITRAPTFKR